MHLAVAECLIENKKLEPSPELYTSLVKHYKTGMKDMAGRAPGNTTKDSVYSLSFANPQGYRIPFNPRYLSNFFLQVLNDLSEVLYELGVLDAVHQ